MTCHFGKCFWSLQTLKSGHWSLQVIYHLARATIVAELHEPRSTKYGLKVRRNEQYSCFYLQFHLYCISARKPLILEFSSICASIAQRQSTGLVNQGSWVQFSLEARGNDCFYFSWFESNERENWDTFKWENPTWRLAFRLCNKVDCSSHLWTVSPLASSTAFCSLLAVCSLQVVDGLKSQCLQYLKM